MSDSLKPRELIQLAHQLFLLISTRPAFIARLTEQQSSAISWVVKNFDEPNTNALSTSSLSSSSISVEKQSLNIVVPLSWLNNYDRPLKAADRVLTGLPLLQALVNTKVSLPLKSSPLPQSYSPEILSRPSLPNPNKIMGDEIVPAPTTTTLTSDQFNQLLQAIGQLSRNCKVIENSQFRPQELGFFNPKNEVEKLVKCLDNTTVYYNVFSFTARVRAKTLGVTEGLFAASKVAMQLDQCLKGKAELWYTNEISNTTRAGLKASVENWCTELEIRFRMSPGKALEKLEKPRYTIDDVRRRKDPEEFVQNVVILGKSAGTAESEYSQLLTAYRHLAAELQIHIPAPTFDTNLTTFIKLLGLKKDDWFEIWRPVGLHYRPQNQYEPTRDTPNKTHHWNGRGNSSFSYSKNTFNSNNNHENSKGKEIFKKDVSTPDKRPYWKKDLKQDPKYGKQHVYNMEVLK